MSDLLERIADLIQQKFGIMVQTDWTVLLRNALLKLDPTGVHQEQFRKTGGCSDQFLRHLAGEVTVKESYFFRHHLHFHYLCALTQQTLLAQPELPSFSIWSAGCAQGQEIYSLAFFLLENIDPVFLSKIHLSGTDLDERAIMQAKAGLFHPWSLRHVSQHLNEKYFIKINRMQYKLKPHYRLPVNFTHASLADYCDGLPDQVLDVIMFRNVSIYLTRAARAELYSKFKRILKPAGRLLLSPSDAFPEDKAYQPDPDHNSVFRIVSEVKVRPQPEQLSLSDQRQTSRTRPGPARKQPIHSPILREWKRCSLSQSTFWPVVNDDADGLLNRLIILSNSGKIDEALRLVDTMICKNPSYFSGYFWRGTLNLSLGKYEVAANDLRYVVFHEKDNYIARYWYTLAMELNGENKRTMYHLNKLIEDLKGLNAMETLANSQTTVHELLRAALERRENLL
ncbi:hypothetical protein JXQ70_17275 [bacterium]|nr:hypothetical protein [bacterium]